MERNKIRIKIISPFLNFGKVCDKKNNSMKNSIIDKTINKQ